jgi:hypothetical protein
MKVDEQPQLPSAKFEIAQQLSMVDGSGVMGESGCVWRTLAGYLDPELTIIPESG